MYQAIIYLFYTNKCKTETNIERMIDLGEPLSFPDITKQALSRARQGIKPSLFQELFDLSVDCFYSGNPAGKLWKDAYRVFAVDGSKVQLPSSKSNFEKFSEMFSRENEKRRWSMALASVIYDVCNDYVCHAVIRPFLSSEREAARDHCRALAETSVFSRESVLVFDRGYYSEDMFRFFSEMGFKCVMRLREGINLSKGCDGECRSAFPADPGLGIPECPVRVVSVSLDSGITEYLATNIFDSGVTRADFKELYFKRWGVELLYDRLKNKLLMEEFSGATSTSVEQEFFINVLYANLASLVKQQADPEIEKNADPDNAYRYQANRSFIYARLKETLAPFLCRRDDASRIDRLFKKAPSCKSQVQPGRSTPRKKVKRDRTHFNNRKTAV